MPPVMASCARRQGACGRTCARTEHGGARRRRRVRGRDLRCRRVDRDLEPSPAACRERADQLAAGQVEIGLSIGITRSPDDADDLDHLLSHADLALYEAKQAGRGTYRFFSSAPRRCSTVASSSASCARPSTPESSSSSSSRVPASHQRIVAAEGFRAGIIRRVAGLRPPSSSPLPRRPGSCCRSARGCCGRPAGVPRRWTPSSCPVNVAPAQFRRGDLVARLRGNPGRYRPAAGTARARADRAHPVPGRCGPDGAPWRHSRPWACASRSTISAPAIRR